MREHKNMFSKSIDKSFSLIYLSMAPERWDEASMASKIIRNDCDELYEVSPVWIAQYRKYPEDTLKVGLKKIHIHSWTYLYAQVRPSTDPPLVKCIPVVVATIGPEQMYRIYMPTSLAYETCFQSSQQK